MSTDPVTAPDMESVIAGVLFGHALEMWTVDDDGATAQCCCGEVSIIVTPHGEDPDNPAAEWIATHQARAVLAALEQAGSVEWGVENGHTPIDHVTKAVSREAAEQEAYDRNLIGIPARVVSRITGPWTAVE